MKKINKLFFLVIIIVLISCPTDDQKSNNEIIEKYPSAIIIAGVESNGINNIIKIWKSVNGGITWTTEEITDGTYNTGIYGLVKVNSILYLLGSEYNGVEYVRKIWKSIDFGINWTVNLVNSDKWWSNSVFFTDGKDLYLSARLSESGDTRNGDNIWKSLDEGENWSLITNERIGGGAVVTNGSTIYAVGNKKVYKSIDGANTWSSSATLTNMTQTFPGGIFVDGSNIYVVGSDYSAPSGCGVRVWISTDNGENWDTKILSNENLYAFPGDVFLHNSIIFISGDAYDEVEEKSLAFGWESRNNGITWIENENYLRSYAKYGSLLYVLGVELIGEKWNTKFWKSSNNGETWIKYVISDGLNEVSFINIIIIE